MDHYFQLVMAAIDAMLDITSSASKSSWQLNKSQCMYLAHKLADIRDYLLGEMDILSAMKQWQQCLKQLYYILNKAEMLVMGCSSEQWLLAAVSLAKSSEHFTEILFELQWWTDVVCFAIMETKEGEASQGLQYFSPLKSAAENYETQLSTPERDALHNMILEDEKMLLAKLEGMKGEHVSRPSTHIGLDQDCSQADYLYQRLTLSYSSWIAQLQEDESLHKVTIHKLLGQGAYGTVLEVTWMGHRCALKVFGSVVQTEAAILAGLQHPHIVQLLCYWETDDKSFLAMQLMTEDLSTLMKRLQKNKPGSPFTLPVAIDIMLQVAKGMRYLHSQGVAHRDLKCSNILYKSSSVAELSAEGYVDVKLADFGTAKANLKTSTPSLEQTWKVGSTKWRAPELYGVSNDMYTEEPNSRRLAYPLQVDVWSFAMTCFEILTGEAPFQYLENGKIQERITVYKERPELPAYCLPYLRFCISSCWKTQPQSRPSFSDICKMFKYAKGLVLGLTGSWIEPVVFAYKDHDGMMQLMDAARLESNNKSTGCIPCKVTGVVKTIRENTRQTSRAFRHKILVLSSGLQLPVRWLHGRKMDHIHQQMILEAVGTENLFSMSQMKRATKGFAGDHIHQQMIQEAVGTENLFSISQMERATKGFAGDRMLGFGGLYTIYKGTLENGMDVAVKKLHDNADPSTFTKVLKEVMVSSKFKHRNVSNLLGCCLQKIPILVYDFMPQGSLFGRLHGKGSRVKLVWSQRLRIATETAEGLAYLHTSHRICHRNVRPASILLDETLTAKIGGFSLCREIQLYDAHVSTFVRGTVGHTDPEYSKTGRLTLKSDVYSFGVVLLELITSRKPFELIVPGEVFELVSWSIPYIEKGQLDAIVDLHLVEDLEFLFSVEHVARLAAQCVAERGQDRPSMQQVLQGLRTIRAGHKF